jgi:uncharacterized protein YbcI
VALEPDQAHQTRGELAAAISNSFVRLVKEHADRGATKCRTYIDEDLIIVLMPGGFSRLENTLFEDGKWLDVRQMRHAFQEPCARTGRRRLAAYLGPANGERRAEPPCREARRL